MVLESMAGRLNEPKIVRPSRRRKAEYVARGMRVRPMERAALGIEESDFGDELEAEGDADAGADAGDEADADADADTDADADVDVVDGGIEVVAGGEGGALFL